MFMMRNTRWKYNYYPGYDPELYDMENDPDELVDLGKSPGHAEIRAHCHEQMCRLVDPDAANRLAFGDQAQLIEKLGGVDAILNSEEYDFTPVQQ
jgi:choline-sulfatase